LKSCNWPLAAGVIRSVFMMRILFLLLVVTGLSLHAAEVTPEDATARLAVCHQLARETNRKELVDEVKSAGDRVKARMDAQDFSGADKVIRDLEPKLGIDPGGWSMSGLKIFHPRPQMLAEAKALEPKLAAAMLQENPDAVRAVVQELRNVLGDQAGMPDARRKGSLARRQPLTEAQAAEYFVKALAVEKKSLRPIAEGKPVPDQLLRFYASIVTGCCEVRPAVAKHQPATLSELDRLVAGACAIMTGLQQPDGHFPFPDLRGKNIRFGDMTEKLASRDPAAVKDGWIIGIDPGGGMQFDNGRCGSALLRAGQTHTNAAWLKAGRLAADWALTQACVPNFNYNAFSLGLLADAYRVTRDQKYLTGALRKLAVGVAPGQVENGRWIDAHNARSVYHVILLQSLNDLAEALPSASTGDREQVRNISARAVDALLEEFERIGATTTSALREFIRFETLHGTTPRLRPAIELTASVVREKCIQGERAKFGVAPEEFAALASAWKH
jgi:hypothetical protein